MESHHIMVIMIVLIVMAASVIKAPHRARGRDKRGSLLQTPEDTAETARLREEVKMLRERLQVLERITVEKENSLEREIEALRDR